MNIPPCHARAFSRKLVLTTYTHMAKASGNRLQATGDSSTVRCVGPPLEIFTVARRVGGLFHRSDHKQVFTTES
jgi:hypothetical protein